MTRQTLLVEIGTEELPPKSLAMLAQAFADKMTAELTNSHLAHGAVRYFASPRRLAVQVEQLATAQADSEIEKRGPAVAQAFDGQGQPTPAALGWAKGCGIKIEQASRLATDKGEWLYHKAQVIGQQTVDLLPSLIEKALTQLPVPKMMRWADKSIQFIRPIHTVTVLLGEQLVKGSILSIAIDRRLRGHRFMGQAELSLTHAEDYLSLLLEKGKVMADYQQRRALIEQQVKQAAQQLGGKADITPALLDEVTALVEWPVVLTARFEEKFLAVPSQALVHTMKSDQKYFPVYDAQGQLLPYFIFVSNIDSKDPSQVIAGNEKVVRPRLADAEFFFNTDKQQPLEQRLPRLHQVLFQQQLGSLRDKTDRIQLLAAEIARTIGADVVQTERAALLAKCDLLTNMVFEFPETQGVMGMHYARADGEDEAVANALNEQYQPRFAGDALPNSLVACALAIADKLDSLVGIFGIGQAPKGDKDPFALRRAALGILRISVEKKLPLDLHLLITKAIAIYQDNQPNALTNANTLADVFDFMLARFRHWYQELGYPLESIAAVLARRPTVPYDFDLRVKAVEHFRSLPEAAALAAANKRVANLLDKQDGAVEQQVNVILLQASAEKALWDQLCQLQPVIAQAKQQDDYQALLTALAGLRQGVDDFFADVMVMDDDLAIRANRLALLQQLRSLFLQVADISLLQ